MPTWDESVVVAAAARLRLAVDARRRLGQGARLGRGPGSSLEFHDHRAYEPGDDLRHLDWSVYARTDQLVLRRHRQEVSPRLELFVDCSLSMAVTPTKITLAIQLAALIATLSDSDGVRPRLWICGSAAVRHEANWRVVLKSAEVAGIAGLDAECPGLVAGSDRVLISDGLSPAGGATVIRRLGAGAGRICLLQIMTPDELAPTVHGAARLEDVEGGVAELVMDETTITEYRERLSRHQDGWRAALAGRGAGMITMRSDEGFTQAVRRLVEAGVVEPRSGRS